MAGLGSSTRLQSAMEYLMTYGWAVLIIAVVLSVLYYLGILNSAAFAIKLSPGSCLVVRPEGPESTGDIAAEGVCNDGLPQYVAKFNGASSEITAAPGWSNSINQGTTITGWFNIATLQNNGANGYTILGGSGSDPWFITVDTSNELHFWTNGFGNNYGGSVNANQWYFFAVTLSAPTSPTVTLYLNGQQVDQNTYNGDTLHGLTDYYIGQTSLVWNGLIANIQIYNTSFSQSDVNTLYYEGIGGDPQELQNLVAWWPLNGDAKDYSGNLYEGTAKNIQFTSTWTNSYASP